MRQFPFIMVLAVLPLLPGAAQPTFVDTLAAGGRLGIPVAQARRLEARLGQLLVINVDGFGYSGALALAPGFAELVRKIQVGGVIPHYGSTDYQRIVRTNQALAGMTETPLLICSDIVKLMGAKGTASFGDGYVGGFLGRFRQLPDAELETLARLNAFVFSALGVNVALGPTVDVSTAEPRVVERARLVLGQMKLYGLAPVLKHFPALPTGASLHKESPDTRIPAGLLEEREAVFRALDPNGGLMMTTHLYDSLVDASIVTFSPVWNAILRERTGFRGLLMSDGLLMLRNYADRSLLSGGPTGRETVGVDETALWAARAILAGHDMVIVEGSAAQTTRAYQGLLTIACAGTALGNRLAGRIEESWERIIRWKTDRAATLRRTVEVPAAVVQSVIALLPAEGAELARFRFDRAALARLDPAISAAEQEP